MRLAGRAPHCSPWEHACVGRACVCKERALDPMPSGSSSLTPESETAARKAPLVRRIPASQANRPWGFPHSAFVPRETSCNRSGPLLDFRSRGSVARIIAIANQKGGVGKTTRAVHPPAVLASAKAPHLLVDCDSQANTTAAIGFAKDPSRHTLYHSLILNEPAERIIQKSQVDGLDVVPADKNLAGAAVELVTSENQEYGW